jgi:hypothetical protein
MPILGTIASQVPGRLSPWTESDYESIATVYGTGSSTYVVFSSIPQTYKHLQLRINARNGRNVSVDSMLFYFNGVTSGGQYTYRSLYADGSSADYYAGTSASTGTFLGIMTGSTAPANVYGSTIVDILDYSSTVKNKTAKAISAEERNGAGDIYFSTGSWMNTAGISSISIGSNNAGANWTTNSQFALYGIKG